LEKSTHHASVGSAAKLVEVQRFDGSVQLQAVRLQPGVHAVLNSLAAEGLAF